MSQQLQVEPVAADPVPTTNWGAYMVELYMSRKPPYPLGTVAFAEIEAKAREVLKDHEDAFMYAYGSAGTNATYAANLKAFQQYRIIPRMLVNTTVRNLETTLFGITYPSPILMAPIGVQAIFSEGAEESPARAGQRLGIPYIMSTASSRSIEEIAAANGDGHRWYQLYWPRTDEVTLSILRRAKASGFTALVVTLDTNTIGWRPHDLATAYLPFAHGFGISVGSTDPVFMARYGLQPSTEHSVFPYEPAKLDALLLAGDEALKQQSYLGNEWIKECNSGYFRNWEDIKFLRENWDGPLILKGIQHVLDAERSLNIGVDGIIVSNHGGRQVDGAIPSLYALDTIMQSPVILEAQRTNKLTILFDSGVRTGSDILKAIALGAQGVLLGRPWLYGAIIAGQDGVEQVLKHTLADLDVSLALSGYQTLSEVRGKRELIVVKTDL